MSNVLYIGSILLLAYLLAFQLLSGGNLAEWRNFSKKKVNALCKDTYALCTSSNTSVRIAFPVNNSSYFP